MCAQMGTGKDAFYFNFSALNTVLSLGKEH
nr:MAG TPA_asm: hypothetical protein [Caudoviricetes sp.]